MIREGVVSVTLLRRIERFLHRSGMRPTRFGRDSVHDPRLVFDMRMGREPRSDTTARISQFLDLQEQLLGEKPQCRRR
jgi:hypothetical protein